MRRNIIIIVAGIGLLAAGGLLLIAAFPVSPFKDRIARRLSDQLGARVVIGAIDRREAISFSPTIILKDVAIGQPAWAGTGNMVDVRAAQVRLSTWSLIGGGDGRPDDIVLRGLSLALVRDASGRRNWTGPKPERDRDEPDDGGRGLRQLTIPDGRVTLRDARRKLTLAGTITVDGRGLRVASSGRFHDAPAQLTVTGGAIAGQAADAPYPIRLAMASPLLRLDAQGTTRGPLNLRAMALTMHAAAPNLKYLDDVIEAGLFGTEAIDLRAKLRRAGRDWFIDSLSGRIGRSPLTANASVLKRSGRTKIDANVRFSGFHFDDLSDAEGRAKARAIEARIGARVLPGTRINLAKVGPTDGVVRFRADRLLMPNSTFRSLAGTIRLEGKLLRLDSIDAGLTSGRMTGSASIDQRGGAAKPRFAMDLRFRGGRLENLIGSDAATGPFGGRVTLAGTGDTIREALGHADGRAGLIVRDGSIKRTFAAVLGQDLGKAIGTALRNREAEVPLRCMAIGFAARGGTLTPSPFLIDTLISSGQGSGSLSLASERIALTVRGRSRDPSGLRLVDPIRIGGTLSRPAIGAAGDPPGSKTSTGTILKAVGKSIGGALGLNKRDDRSRGIGLAPIDCYALERRVLAAR